MKWFIFVDDYGHVFTGDTKEETIEFIVERLENDYGVEPDSDGYFVVLGEEKQFVPPSSKGDLI